jgi:hypothetical protein
VNRLRILIAAAAVGLLGYFVAFGSDYGSDTAYARKSTSATTSVKKAGNSNNTKTIVVSSVVVAGNTSKHIGKGQIKTSTGTTIICKPPGGSNGHTCG